MITCSIFYLIKRRFIMLFFALLLLCGCGSQPLPIQRSQTTPTPIPSTPTSVPTSNPTASGSGSTTSESSTSGPSRLGIPIDFKLDSWLHVYSIGGFTCSVPSPNRTAFTLTPGVLVLPKTHPTDEIYDQGRLQSLENYLDNARRAFDGAKAKDANTGNLDGLPYPAFSANPDAFQLMAVGSTSGFAACSEVLHITNIGNVPVQISQISVQLTADTQVDNHHYNLIDICSIPPSTPGCAPGPSGGSEQIYTAQFALQSGKANDVIPAGFWGKPMSGPGPQPPLALRPGESAKVNIFYGAKSNLSFSLLPSFTLDWLGKQTTYPVPQLRETFALASASQFSCYSLKSLQFREIPSSSIFSMGTNSWCI